MIPKLAFPASRRTVRAATLAMLLVSLPATGVLALPASAGNRHLIAPHPATAPILVAQRRRHPEGQTSRPGEVAGRYAVLRESNKDTGCLVTLQPGGRALLGPGCTDQGIVVFDPVQWAVSGGHLVLRARKGHRITFNRNAEGNWWRQAEKAKPIGLHKM